MMSLDDIAAVVKGPAAGADWRDVVQACVAAITEQLQRLTSATAYLEHLLGCPREDPAADCPYLRADRAERASRRPGEVVPGKAASDLSDSEMERQLRDSASCKIGAFECAT